MTPRPVTTRQLPTEEGATLPNVDANGVDRLLSAASRLAETIATTEDIIQRRADLLRRPTQMRGPVVDRTKRSPGLVSLAEAAKRTGRHPEVLRRWCIEGKIPGVRIGRTWAIGSDVVAELIAHSARSRPRLPSSSA